MAFKSFRTTSTQRSFNKPSCGIRVAAVEKRIDGCWPRYHTVYPYMSTPTPSALSGFREAVRWAACAIEMHFHKLKALQSLSPCHVRSPPSSSTLAVTCDEAGPALRRMSLYCIGNEFGDAAFPWDDVCVSFSPSEVSEIPLCMLGVRVKNTCNAIVLRSRRASSYVVHADAVK